MRGATSLASEYLKSMKNTFNPMIMLCGLLFAALFLLLSLWSDPRLRDDPPDVSQKAREIADGLVVVGR